MRIVALEEHFTVPTLVQQIDRQSITARGFPPPDAPWGPGRQREKLHDLGQARLRSMDESGVTMQVLSVSGPGADLLPPDRGPDWAKAANDTLAEAVAAHPTRYAGFAHLPMTAPDAAARELERCVRQLGFHGALINGLTDNRFLDDSFFAPILRTAEELGVPIYLHPGLPPAAVRQAYYDGLDDGDSYLFSAAGWGWHAETAVHILRLAISGTLERYPGLQWIIGHMGEGLPMMLARCDQVFGRDITGAVTSHVHVTTSGFFTLPPFLALLHTFGVDRIMFSIDYPFAPNDKGRAFLDSLPVSPEDRVKIAHGNADKLLKLRVA
jgi:uncharacterized protein